MTIPDPTPSAAPLAATVPDALLEFRNIRIVYDNAIEAIRDVSIAVPNGNIVALLGSNGAGKSTLLKAMSGILYTEEGVVENGSIRFRNDEVHRLAPDELVRRGIVQAGTIGYWVGLPHAHRGYMTTALRVLLPSLFGELNLHRIEAACIPSNASSIRVLEKCGFTREGLARRYLCINGIWQDHLLFGLLHEDFRG